MLTRNFNLDIIHSTPPVVIHISQYDTATTLVFALYSSDGTLSMPTSAEDVSAMIHGTKPDRHGISMDAEYSYSDGTPYVTVNVTRQMTAIAGKNVFELHIIYNGESLFTSNFVLQVEKAALDLDSFVSDSEIQEPIDLAVYADDIIQAAGRVNSAQSIIDQGVSDAQAASAAAQRYASNASASAAAVLDSILNSFVAPRLVQATIDTKNGEVSAMYELGIPVQYAYEETSNGIILTHSDGLTSTITVI